MQKRVEILIIITCITLVTTIALFGCKTGITTETIIPETTTSETTAAETTAAEEKFTIGMTVWTMGDTFTVQLNEGVKAAVEALGHEFISLDNEGGKEVDNTRTLISKNVDGVYMCYWDPNLAKTSIDMLKEANIPILAIDIPMSDTCFLGVNNYDVGFKGGDFLADWILENWDGNIDLLMTLNSPTEGPIVAQRFQGQEDAVLAKIDYPADKIERQDCGGWAEGALKAARPILAKHPDAEKIAICVENDPSVQGIMTALAEAGKSENAAMVTQGISKDAIHLIKEGKLPVIGGVAYFPDKYGVQGINQLIEMIKLCKAGTTVVEAIKQVVPDVLNNPETGEYICQTIYVQTEILTSQNIDDYYPE